LLTRSEKPLADPINRVETSTVSELEFEVDPQLRKSLHTPEERSLSLDEARAGSSDAKEEVNQNLKTSEI